MSPSVLPATAEPTVLDHSAQSPTGLLYRAAVGPISADYYLPLLARFETEARAPFSWNWAACLYTLNWMAFRGLWVAALAYIGLTWLLPLLVLGMGRLVLQLSDTADLAFLVVWGILGFVVPGLVGNAVLRADLRKRMTRAITASKTLVEACGLLAAQASSRQRLIGLGVVNLIVLGGVVGFYLALPEDGVMARVRTDTVPARGMESGPVLDLTAAPAFASTPMPVTPVSAPQAIVPEQPASTPPAAVAPEPVLALAEPSKPAGVAASAPATAKPYFINVGLFSQEANARRAQTTLQDAGLRPVVQEIGAGQDKRIRLRAGPFDTRAEAESAAEKIRTLKLEARLIQP